MPLLSIIVPVYNAEAYLRECIDSIIAQRYQDWELLLINDGSVDDSLEICTKYSHIDQRIKVFSQTNQGVSAARNRGLEEAVGEYITFVDADDTVSDDVYCDNMKHILSDSGIDILIYPFRKDNHDYVFSSDNLSIVTEKLSILNVWLQNLPLQFAVTNKIFHKNLLAGQSFIIGKRTGEDLFFTMSLMPNINKVLVSNSGYYYYRTNYNGVTQTFDARRMREKIDELWCVENYLLSSQDFSSITISYFIGKLLELNKVFQRYQFSMTSNDVEKLRTVIPRIQRTNLFSGRFTDIVYLCAIKVLGIKHFFGFYNLIDRLK